MSVLELPAILDIPNKLLPIIERINDFRYFMIEGGRGSGKSHSVARLLLYLADTRNVRIFCGRETQVSIDESVYTLFSDLIRKYQLAFNINASSIDHRFKNSPIRFRGFREQGAINIKGIEGMDICWVDEAQAISKTTLDVLIPTIRKDNAKVFWTMNRHLKDDPVYLMFKGRKDCLHIHIDYFENQHCPEALKHEAEECKARNTDDYNHIWLGEPMNQANNAVFRNVSAIVENYASPVAPQSTFEYVLGVDLARSIDNTVLVVMNKQLKRVEYFERMENENKTSWNYQKEKIAAVSKRYNNALTVVDSSGIGDPITEDLLRAGVNVYFHERQDSGKVTPGVKFSSINKENLIEKLKVAIEMKMISIPNERVLIDELIAYESISLPSGQYRFSAPEGKHDDCVIALSLALWGTNYGMYDTYHPPRQVEPVEEFWRMVKDDIKNTTNSLDISEEEYILSDEGKSLSEE